MCITEIPVENSTIGFDIYFSSSGLSVTDLMAFDGHCELVEQA